MLPWVSCILIFWATNRLQKPEQFSHLKPRDLDLSRRQPASPRKDRESPSWGRCGPPQVPSQNSRGTTDAQELREESLLNLILLSWTFVPEKAPACRSSHYIWHPCRGHALKISSEYEEIYPLLDTDPQTSCEQPLLSLSEHVTRTDQLATFQALGTVTASGMNLSHESKSWYLFSTSHCKMCSFLLRI